MPVLAILFDHWWAGAIGGAILTGILIAFVYWPFGMVMVIIGALLLIIAI